MKSIWLNPKKRCHSKFRRERLEKGTEEERRQCNFCADKIESIDYKESAACAVMLPSAAKYCPAGSQATVLITSGN
jgi:ribosomal protein S18